MSNMPDSLTPSGDSREATSTDNLRPNQYEVPRSADEQIEHMIEDSLDLIAATATRDMRRSILRAFLEAAAAHRSAADRQEIERLRAGFCEKHAPNAAQRYSGCVICSRNEESALIEEVLKSFGWAHAEEAELYLHGSQWYCIGDEERGTWDTAAALTKALEDYDSLREAHKKARLFTAKEQARAERAESELEKLRGLLRECESAMGGIESFVRFYMEREQNAPANSQEACREAREEEAAFNKTLRAIRRALSGEERDSQESHS